MEVRARTLRATKVSFGGPQGRQRGAKWLGRRSGQTAAVVQISALARLVRNVSSGAGPKRERWLAAGEAHFALCCPLAVSSVVARPLGGLFAACCSALTGPWLLALGWWRARGERPRRSVCGPPRGPFDARHWARRTQNAEGRRENGGRPFLRERLHLEKRPSSSSVPSLRVCSQPTALGHFSLAVPRAQHSSLVAVRLPLLPLCAPAAPAPHTSTHKGRTVNSEQ